ncbi:MAG: hypothetical protein R8K21_01420 [Mariprofundales bacterium]
MFKYKISFIILILFALSNSAIAANLTENINHTELRFQVDIPTQDMSEALLLAAPILANRLVATDSRTEADKLQLTQEMLRGYVPYIDNTGINSLRLRFDSNAIYNALQKLGVHILVKQARMQIKISLPKATKNNQQNAKKDVENLILYVQELAMPLGIRMDNDAPLWSISWQWMNQSNRVLQLTAQGYSDKFHEIRQIPIVTNNTQSTLATTLRPWLESVLLRIRDSESLRQTLAIDTYANTNSSGISMADGVNNNKANILTIKSSSLTLNAIIKIENDLRDDPRIQQLSLYSLGTHQQQYHVRMYGNNSNWLNDWFARRNMHLHNSDGGWVVR